MIKTAQPTTTAAHSKNHSDTPNKEMKASSQFIGATLTMSWQLAIVVLVPVIGGFEIDKHFGSSPVGTIIGFLIAMVGFGLVVKKTLDENSVDLSKKDKN
jgi:F0F1-type ATP synthase assembly protein I